MTDAQYSFIRDKFPRLAKQVEYAARRIAIDPDNQYCKGMACGLACAMVETKQCGDAVEFLNTAIEKAKKRYGKEA